MSTAARAAAALAAANLAVLALLALRAQLRDRRTARQNLRDTYSREALAIAAHRAHTIAAAVTAHPHTAIAAAMHRHPSAPAHAAHQLTQHLQAGCDGACPTALNLLWLTGSAAPQSERQA